MGCGAVEGIGAVVRSCGGCAPRPPTKQWVRAGQIPAAVYGAIGTQVNLGEYVKSLRSRDQNGRHAHVVGLLFRGTYGFTLVDASTAEVPGYDMLAAWSNLFLRDNSGWIYWGGNLDGRNLRDDLYYRNYRANAVFPLPTTIAANAGAGAVTRDLTMYCPLSRLDDEEGAGLVMGSIPLASLQARGDDCIQFTHGQPTGANGTTYTDVTPTGFTGTIELWVELVYVDNLVIDAPWQLENYTIQELSSQLRHPDREHEYVILRYLPGDTGGVDADDLSGITVDVDGTVIMSALATSAAGFRDRAQVADVLDVVPGDLYFPAGTDIPGYAFIPRARSRAESAAGKVSFDISTRATHTTNRFLHRTVSCHDGDRAAMIAEAAKCFTGTYTGLCSNGCGAGEHVVAPTAPIVVVERPNANLTGNLLTGEMTHGLMR